LNSQLHACKAALSWITLPVHLLWLFSGDGVLQAVSQAGFKPISSS
jgi:hypothetical protein